MICANTPRASVAATAWTEDGSIHLLKLALYKDQLARNLHMLSILAEKEQRAMKKLTAPMKRLIANYNAGAVGTINEDGTPAVSPKATFVVIDDGCIAFGNIRACPDVEVNFIDVLTRRAVRVKGRAEIVEKASDAGRRLLPAFREHWAPYLPHMQCFVSISVTYAQLVLSPAYDLGHTADELRRVNLDKLAGAD